NSLFTVRTNSAGISRRRPGTTGRLVRQSIGPRRPVGVPLQEFLEILRRDPPLPSHIDGAQVPVLDPVAHGNLADLQQVGHVFYRQELACQHLTARERLSASESLHDAIHALLDVDQRAPIAPTVAE